MRIEGTEFPALQRFKTPAPHPQHERSFDDLLTLPHQVLRFDAVGVLGTGGQVPSAAARAPALPDNAEVEPSTEGSAPAEAAWSRTGAWREPAAASAYRSQEFAASGSHRVVAVRGLSRPLAGSPAFMSIAAPLEGRATPFSRASVAGSIVAWSAHPEVVAADKPPVSKPPSCAGDEAEMQAPADGVTETPADPSPDQVSVSVSENEGQLHVVAAAPGLTEEARQKLRDLADEIARGAGTRLGTFFLNGAAVSHFFHFIDRRS